MSLVGWTSMRLKERWRGGEARSDSNDEVENAEHVPAATRLAALRGARA